MKIQNLAVIFIIIILPISMILTSYTRNHVKTLNLQTSYDAKLNNATSEALKAFQLNTVNSSTSDLSNSKLRDIEASVNTFYDSIASHFNMAGYDKEVLKNYVPALVYTMYDGYYIYSSFTNKLTSNEDGLPEATYKNEDKVTELKPYIYYSCRYIRGGIDVVISYTLDNYITVQGTINDKPVYRYGYLIDNSSGNGTNSATYRGIPIGTEELKENSAILSNNRQTLDTQEYTYTQINGVKYYQDTDGTWFSMLNGDKYKQNNYKTTNNAAVKYYSDAAIFKNFMETNGLTELRASDAVDELGNPLKDKVGNPKFGNSKIFEYNNNGVAIEEPNSNFNQHRLAVIRYAIEKNLSIAIANYNRYTGVTTNFQMPELKEDEWNKIINNVSVISFLQGLSIGGKIYNGYSIITNTKNKEVVSEDSIYITTRDGATGEKIYHKAIDADIANDGSKIEKGILNVDFERKSVTTSGANIYYYPQNHLGCYNSIVNQASSADGTDNIYDYMKKIYDKGNIKLATTYLTALGRERYSMYKTNNNPEELKKLFYQ